ncbi:hypothetical protein EPUS_05083 [Endocarpon pusillum Z07020]|uniref:Uncharacterized protein n=1 Tax=Endocarpon pusillum (strain Z07020 / HMAS-L-300199) TaxID=1263415 RepID=U1GG44_ENDPU|nr:uncharacterized protein EPUS_05083 [Endocarpon pusillum Z07020]ERF70731.1 hypothetical protein EPUS_05083 [Endocarpon pusillum Z07020]
MAQRPPNMRYEICASSEESKVLLETTQDVNEQIYMVRKLRRQRSANLTPSEKTWIDSAIENTSNAVSGITHFVEPVPESPPAGRQWMPGPSFLQQLKYLIKDSPQLSAQLVRLSVAAQLLSTAMSVLSACVTVTSEGQVRSTGAGTNTVDSSWNELSEFIHRRRFNSTPSLAGDKRIPPAHGAQSGSPQSWNNVQPEERSPTEDQWSESSPAASARSSGSATCQTQTSSDGLKGPIAVSPPVQPGSQKCTTRSAEMTDRYDMDHGLTLIIETVEEWRQTTERALNDINALSRALTSGMMDRSISILRRTQPLRTPEGQVPFQKPVPARTLSPLPPRPIIELSLRNSFDKESLPHDNYKTPIPGARFLVLLKIHPKHPFPHFHPRHIGFQEDVLGWKEEQNPLERKWMRLAHLKNELKFQSNQSILRLNRYVV